MHPGLIVAAVLLCSGSSPLAAGTTSSGSRIGHARLEGSVGFESGSKETLAFDSKTIKEVFAQASVKKCDVVLLEIESGGGLVHIGLEIVKELREKLDSGQRLVVWYGQAGSAASWIPFACPVAVTKPNGMCGGSVIYKQDDDGNVSPVDAKFASFRIAAVKNAAEAAHRPTLLVDAIFEQPREVWITGDGSLVADKPADDPKARCIDSKTGVLNLDAASAVSIGFAKGPAADRDSAARAAGLTPTSWVDLTPIVSARSSRLAAQDARTRKAVYDWFNAINEMEAKIVTAIEDTQTTAAAYESSVIPDGATKVLGSRARKALADHMNKVRSAASVIKFDDAIVPDGQLEQNFRDNYPTMHAAILERVSKIRDLLEQRSTKRVLDAIDEALRLLAEIQDFKKSLKRPY